MYTHIQHIHTNRLPLGVPTASSFLGGHLSFNFQTELLEPLPYFLWKIHHPHFLFSLPPTVFLRVPIDLNLSLAHLISWSSFPLFWSLPSLLCIPPPATALSFLHIISPLGIHPGPSFHTKHHWPRAGLYNQTLLKVWSNGMGTTLI